MTRRRELLALAALCGLHAALGVWAIAAWQAGPFEGRAILDGTEVLQAAETGSAGPFETKSPLYPAVLGVLLRATGERTWTIGLFNLACSVGVLLLVHALGRRLAGVRAGLAAATAWCATGVSYAFIPQPLPALAAAALLAGAFLLRARLRERDIPGLGASMGALVVAATLTRAPLLLCALILALDLAARRMGRSLAGFFATALVVGMVGTITFDDRAWPEGGSFNLRLGNGPDSTGTPIDWRPGPRYQALRYEPFFAGTPSDAPIDADRFHLIAAVDTCLEDPGGTVTTLMRKTLLFWHRTEIVTGGDFRHGLAGFPPLMLLLLSFGVIAPLALASLFREQHPPPSVWIPIVAVLLANIAFLTSARYRFAAVPFVCVAAGTMFAPGTPRRAWIVAVVMAIVLNLNWSGVSLVVPGDGLVQDAHARMQVDPAAPRAREALERAVAIGSDPRADYLLGLWYEGAFVATGDRPHFERADQHYLRAIEGAPDYPQPIENRIRLWAQIDPQKAAGLARQALLQPFAGRARFALADLMEHRASPDEIRSWRAEGHRIMALRFLAQNELAAATEQARLAAALGVLDARLGPLVR